MITSGENVTKEIFTCRQYCVLQTPSTQAPSKHWTVPVSWDTAPLFLQQLVMQNALQNIWAVLGPEQQPLGLNEPGQTSSVKTAQHSACSE